MGEIRYAYMTLFGYLKTRDKVEDLSVDGKLILKWILSKKVLR
jgi:hypothetical protein